MNVTAYDLSSSSLNVSWSPLHERYHEGVLIGYNISYKVVDNYTDIRGGSLVGVYNCSGGEKTSCKIPGLSLHTPYGIRVAAVTIAGNGLWSSLINGTTGDYGKLELTL